MVYLLRADKHDVLQAHDGDEGIALARGEKPDLILLDIHMPRMDGYEVQRNLSQYHECDGIPVVAVTALAMVGDREKVLAAGFTGYMAKPIDPRLFPSQIQSFLLSRVRDGGEPVSRNVQRAISAPAPAKASARSTEKLALVLFVDNTQTNIDVVRHTLEPSGYEVLTARSVHDGFALAKCQRPDLIVSDVHMPHQDGYEFMRMVRGDPELSEIPFVFLSSSVWSNQEQQRALRQGAKKFLSRPIEARLLLSEIEECLRKK